MKIIKTYKMGPIRYLHQIEIPGRGYFHVVTDSDYFSMTSRTVIRNKVLTKLSGNETRGLRFVREREKRFDEVEWAWLCFGGEDNLELRKKIYGKELRKIELEILVYPRSGRVTVIRKKGSDDMIPGRSAWIRRNLRKRIKDPLPYIVLKQMKLKLDDKKPVYLSYTVTELSYLMFKRRVNEWYG